MWNQIIPLLQPASPLNWWLDAPHGLGVGLPLVHEHPFQPLQVENAAAGQSAGPEQTAQWWNVSHIGTDVGKPDSWMDPSSQDCYGVSDTNNEAKQGCRSVQGERFERVLMAPRGPLPPWGQAFKHGSRGRQVVHLKVGLAAGSSQWNDRENNDSTGKAQTPDKSRCRHVRHQSCNLTLHAHANYLERTLLRIRYSK